MLTQPALKQHLYAELTLRILPGENSHFSQSSLQYEKNKNGRMLLCLAIYLRNIVNRKMKNIFIYETYIFIPVT